MSRRPILVAVASPCALLIAACASDPSATTGPNETLGDELTREVAAPLAVEKRPASNGETAMADVGRVLVRRAARAGGPASEPLESLLDAPGVHCAGVAGERCAVGQTCCRAPRGGATCVAKGAPCAGAKERAWVCSRSADCGTGQVCCGTATVGEGPSGPVLTRFRGTRCATSCSAGEFTVCERATDCGGKTCAGSEACGATIGLCR